GTVVQTKLVRTDGDPIALNYLMRESDGAWKVIDVFLNGTASELATRRSEFSSVLRRDGADGLVKLLERRAAEGKGWYLPSLKAESLSCGIERRWQVLTQ